MILRITLPPYLSLPTRSSTQFHIFIFSSRIVSTIFPLVKIAFFLFEIVFELESGSGARELELAQRCSLIGSFEQLRRCSISIRFDLQNPRVNPPHPKSTTQERGQKPSDPGGDSNCAPDTTANHEFKSFENWKKTNVPKNK